MPGTVWCPWHTSPGYRPSGLRKDHRKEERGQDAASLKMPQAGARSRRLEWGWTSSSDLVPLNLLESCRPWVPTRLLWARSAQPPKAALPARAWKTLKINQPAGSTTAKHPLHSWHSAVLLCDSGR